MSDGVMLCACGDWRPLQHMYFRPCERRITGPSFEVACVDCIVSDGGDIGALLTMADALRFSEWEREQYAAYERAGYEAEQGEPDEWSAYMSLPRRTRNYGLK